MRQLEEYSLKAISDYLVSKIAEERGIGKKLARSLFINALSYNLVVAAIMEQVNYLMENDEEEDPPHD